MLFGDAVHQLSWMQGSSYWDPGWLSSVGNMMYPYDDYNYNYKYR